MFRIKLLVASLLILSAVVALPGVQSAQAGHPPQVSATEVSDRSEPVTYEVWYRRNANQRWTSYGWGYSLYDAASVVRDLQRMGYQAFYEREIGC
jgi:hypothetical protein